MIQYNPTDISQTKVNVEYYVSKYCDESDRRKRLKRRFKRSMVACGILFTALTLAHIKTLGDLDEANFDKDFYFKALVNLGVHYQHLHDRLDSLANARPVKVYEGQRGRDYVEYSRLLIGNEVVGYKLKTNFLKDTNAFKRVDKWVDHGLANGVDVFWIRNGFRESRLGANMAHKVNYDGTRDHGFLGVNDIHVKADSVLFFEYESAKALEVYRLRESWTRPRLAGGRWLNREEVSDFIWATGRVPKTAEDLAIIDKLKLGR